MSNNLIYSAFPCALRYSLGNCMYHTHFQNAVPFPSLPLCCHSSLLSLSPLLLLQLSDDNSLLPASCCIAVEWGWAPSQLTTFGMNQDVYALPAGLPTCSGCVRVNHREVEHSGGLSGPLASCCGQEHTRLIVCCRNCWRFFLFVKVTISSRRVFFFLSPFSLLFISPCSHGQKHCGLSARSRWDDALHVVMLLAAKPRRWCRDPAHFLPFPPGEQANVLLIFYTGGPRPPSWARKCPAGSEHAAWGSQLVVGVG